MDPVTVAATLVHGVAAALGTLHALIYKRDHRAALGWVVVCLFVPFAGPLAYYLFGINRVRSRARRLRRLFAVGFERAPPPSHPGEGLDLGLPSIGERIAGEPMLAGNRVTALVDGAEAYPQMLRAVAAATRTVYLASYIFNLDRIGGEFADALVAAHHRGVDVRVLVDGVGERYSRRRITPLLASRGVAATTFLGPRLWPPRLNINLRNHRKLLLVDGQCGFTGGINISDRNLGGAGAPPHVSDLHFQIEGPVVARLEDTFIEDWRFVTEERIERVPAAPAAAVGEALCRVVEDGPDENLDALALLIQTVISAAAQRVDIVTPYFVPSRELIGTLQSAVLRGVRVRILLPERSNLVFVDWASRNMLAELCQWGVEIHYQGDPFCHAKLLLVDDRYSLIGSANLDPRSLRLNFEIGVEILSAAANRGLSVYMDERVAAGRKLTLGELDGRSLATRARDSAFALFAPYL